MRTTITIPDSYIEELLQYTHTQKITKAINIALREWLRLQKIQAIKKLQGKLTIKNNIHELRMTEVKKQRIL